MRLCFDATRFGSGLQESVAFAAEKNLTACEFSFNPFDVSQKESRTLSASEKEYLKSTAELCRAKHVDISCLRLNFLLKVSDRKSLAEFKSLVLKLSRVAEALACTKLIFYVECESYKGWLGDLEKLVNTIIPGLKDRGISLLLSLSTPEAFRGRSLKSWRPVEPDELRELLAGAPGLALSFSVADFVWQGLDYLKILPGLVPAIEHVDAQDIQVNRQIIAENGLFGPLWWRYMSPGKGQVDWGQFVEALKLYDYAGDISIQFNDEFASDNEQGLQEALESAVKLLAPLVKY